MFSTKLAAILVILSSLVVVNAAVVQRDGGATVTPVSSTAMSTPIKSTETKSVPVTRTESSTLASTPSITKSIPVTRTESSTAKPTPTAGTVSCDGVQEWQAAFAYSAGARVIFNNQLYTAKQWTYNNDPAAHPDQWTLSGTCTQPINNKADCSGVSGWQNNVAYTTGNRVTFKGSLWSAVQWTFGNSPGDNSGSWQNLGVCADP